MRHSRHFQVPICAVVDEEFDFQLKNWNPASKGQEIGKTKPEHAETNTLRSLLLCEGE